MTCREILYNYIEGNEGWHKKVSLYAVAEDWSPETVGRELRSLEEDGKITVGYYDGKYARNLARYTIKVKKERVVYNIIDPKSGLAEGEVVKILNT